VAKEMTVTEPERQRKAIPSLDGIFDILGTEIEDENAIRLVKETSFARTLVHEIVAIPEDKLAEMIAAGMVLYVRRRGTIKVALRGARALGIGTIMKMTYSFRHSVMLKDVFVIAGALRPPNKAKVSPKGGVRSMEYRKPAMNNKTEIQKAS
jgi:hypothetical protein